MTDALAAISHDLDWREGELAAMRVLMLSPISMVQRRGMLRAAWALLYAHYEGFCKQALSIYFDEVTSCGLPCKNLPSAIKLHALEKELKRMKSLKSDGLLSAIEDFSLAMLDSDPEFPEVDTRSNLWPSTLIDLLLRADLNPSKVKEHSAKLKTLVSRRNDIAHGKMNLIEDFAYYRTYEEAVYDVWYDLAFQVDSRLKSKPFA